MTAPNLTVLWDGNCRPLELWREREGERNRERDREKEREIGRWAHGIKQCTITVTDIYASTPPPPLTHSLVRQSSGLLGIPLLVLIQQQHTRVRQRLVVVRTNLQRAAVDGELITPLSVPCQDTEAHYAQYRQESRVEHDFREDMCMLSGFFRMYEALADCHPASHRAYMEKIREESREKKKKEEGERGVRCRQHSSREKKKKKKGVCMCMCVWLHLPRPMRTDGVPDA